MNIQILLLPCGPKAIKHIVMLPLVCGKLVMVKCNYEPGKINDENIYDFNV